jgi:hypothetical protein
MRQWELRARAFTPLVFNSHKLSSRRASGTLKNALCQTLLALVFENFRESLRASSSLDDVQKRRE